VDAPAKKFASILLLAVYHENVVATTQRHTISPGNMAVFPRARIRRFPERKVGVSPTCERKPWKSLYIRALHSGVPFRVAV